MEPPVGLLIVHGIGNQRPGMLARLIAQSLGDDNVAPAADSIAPPRDAAADQGRSEDVRRVMVDGRTVHVCEADWADLSSPDNPPELRVAAYLPREFLRTVAHAWHGFVRRTFFFGKVWKPLSAGGFLMIAVLFALLLGGLVAAARAPADGEAAELLYIPSGAVLLVFLASSVISFTRSSLAWVRARLENTRPIVRSAAMAICLLLAIGIGYVRFFLLFLGAVFAAELLLFLFALVLLTSAINHVGWLLVLVIRCLSAGLGALRLGWARRGINWLGWFALVSPLQTLSQTTKAWANLVSVIYARHSAATRWAAVLAVPGVYFAFILLIVLNEILVLLLLLFFASFGFVRAFPQVLDLILDISNFHLASPSERLVYLERVHEGMERLRRSGCQEIHILAHSLGTVITYEWLATQESRRYPVRMLHTIGSPLDKFWYTDHPEEQRFADEAGLATHPDLAWCNYWALSDPVSGQLDHFGRAKKLVQNIRIRSLGAYLYSHVHYWTHRQVIDGIRAGIAGKQ